MNKATMQQAFANPESLFADVRMPENVAAIAQKSVEQTKEFYEKSSAAAQDGARAMTEIADTAWGSTKLLHEKMVQNMQANTQAAFSAAQAIAGARSLPEVAHLQSQFLQMLTAQAGEQTKEFLDLSARAAQHVLDKVQAATKSMSPGA